MPVPTPDAAGARVQASPSAAGVRATTAVADVDPPPRLQAPPDSSASARAVVEARFQRADLNGDGRLNREEWDDAQSAFAFADRNDDGFVTRPELLAITAEPHKAAGRARGGLRLSPLVLEARFASDANRDGRLTRSEWNGTPSGFDRADVNGDGAVTRLELQTRPNAASEQPDPDTDAETAGSGTGDGQGERVPHEVAPAIVVGTSPPAGSSGDAGWSPAQPAPATPPTAVPAPPPVPPQAAVPSASPPPVPAARYAEPATLPPSRHAAFTALDRDGDKLLLSGEWSGDPEVFTHLDRNHDGVVESGEFVDLLPHSDLAMRFRALDMDGDGRLAPGELGRSSEDFAALDRSLDGFVSREEFLEGTALAQPYESPRERGFRLLDRDLDRRIGSDEWAGTRSAFERLDRNRDGFLDRDEFVHSPFSY